MKYILNRDVGEYRKGTSPDFGGVVFDTWLALGWLDEVDGKWKPKEGEKYWIIQSVCGDVIETT